jgi:thiol-disulfide isomerase/thioredoxin
MASRPEIGESEVGIVRALVAAVLLEVAALIGILHATTAAAQQAPTAPGAPAAPAARPERPAAPLVATITHGARVTLEDHVIPGAVTIFDFYSDYCIPCRRLAGPLERLVRSKPGLFLRKVDINRPGVKGIDGESPVALQHEVDAIPWFVIYDERGRSTSGPEASDWVLQRLGEGT